MRILFTVDQAYLPQRTGGALQSTDALCQALSAREHEVAVLAELLPDGAVGLTNRLKRRLGMQPNDRALGYPVYRDWIPVAQVPALCESFRPDVAIVKSGEDPEVAEAFSARGVPVLVYLRDIEFDRDDWRRPRGANIGFVANTTYASQRFEARFGPRPPVIHSLIEPDAYRVETSREVATFINPVPVKGVDVVFDLARTRPDIPFLVLESWPLKEEQQDELERAAAPLDNVTLQPWTPDINAAYARTRVLLVPSQWVEAQARCVAEVQVSGIPVIASRIGGLPESVGDGGMLVPPTDTAGWRQALGEVWDDQARYDRLVEAALAHSRRDTLRGDHIVSSLLAVIEGHVAAHRVGG